MRIARFQRFVVLFLFFAALAAARAQPASPILQAMDADLQRSMLKLKSQPIAPYFLRYEIVETHNCTVSGAFGEILSAR
jgi:hypothetical protein